ncbi:MAG: hypothetical protein IT324_16615 [Anaerolineae bacterium]|nr:hypothetical protein [Anaerolineae bacterium]
MTNTAQPAQPVQFISDSDMLGALVAEYKPRSTRGTLNLVIGFILCVAGGFAILYSVSGRVPSDDRVPIILLGAFLALIGWAMIESWIRARGLSAQVFTDGFIRIRFNQREVCRWDDVVAVWQYVVKRYYNGVYTGTTHTYTIQKRDGKTLKFDDTLGNVEQLGNTLQEEVARRLLPLAIAAYNRGETVPFGKLSLNTNGLSWGDKTLPWSEVQGVQINKGYLTVKKQGKWLRWANISVSQIPNLLVALTLIDRIVGLNTK